MDSINDFVDMICSTSDAAAFEIQKPIPVEDFEGNERAEAELVDRSIQEMENFQSYSKCSERQEDESTFIDDENTSSSAVSLAIDRPIDQTLILVSPEESAISLALEESKVSNISNEDDHTNQIVDLVDTLVDTPPAYEEDPALATAPVSDSIEVELNEQVIEIEELEVKALYSIPIC